MHKFRIRPIDLKRLLKGHFVQTVLYIALQFAC